MWYVAQVNTGLEERICLYCKERVPADVLERCFIPHCEVQKKIRGRWENVERCLFPGYVFLVAEDCDALFLALKNVPGMTKLLGTGRTIVPLTEGEIRFLNRFGGEEQLVRLSEGVIEGGTVKIIDGPLVTMEGQIKRIDRHKRMAWVDLQMFGRLQTVQVGLEIIAKS